MESVDVAGSGSVGSLYHVCAANCRTNIFFLGFAGISEWKNRTLLQSMYW
jgi:hypothetical protein